VGVLLAAFLDRPALLGERRRTGATLLRVRVTSVIKGRKCVIEWGIGEKRTGTTGATAAALRGACDPGARAEVLPSPAPALVTARPVAR
jgi:hypothetical protein